MIDNILVVIAVILWVIAGCIILHTEEKPVHRSYPQMIG